jgi:predicted nucleic acid-binding protein
MTDTFVDTDVLVRLITGDDSVTQVAKVHNRRILLRALDIYAVTVLDFGDAMTIAMMERRNVSDLYAYDRDFDRISGINRKEP